MTIDEIVASLLACANSSCDNCEFNKIMECEPCLISKLAKECEKILDTDLIDDEQRKVSLK